MRVDTEEIIKIESPLERALAADKGIKDSSLVAKVLSAIKGNAVRELLGEHTADEVGELLGISRTSVHRVAAKSEPYDIVVSDDGVYFARIPFRPSRSAPIQPQLGQVMTIGLAPFNQLTGEVWHIDETTLSLKLDEHSKETVLRHSLEN